MWYSLFTSWGFPGALPTMQSPTWPLPWTVVGPSCILGCQKQVHLRSGPGNANRWQFWQIEALPAKVSILSNAQAHNLRELQPSLGLNLYHVEGGRFGFLFTLSELTPIWQQCNERDDAGGGYYDRWWHFFWTQVHLWFSQLFSPMDMAALCTWPWRAWVLAPTGTLNVPLAWKFFGVFLESVWVYSVCMCVCRIVSRVFVRFGGQPYFFV